jgi:hypothetical protein
MGELTFQALVVIGSAYLGAFLGTRRFVREKRWEAKNKAYQDIVEAVHKISYWAEQHYASVHFLPTPPEDKFEELAKSYEAAREELWRYSAVGELFISREARREVEGLRNEIEQAAFWYEQERTPESHDEDFSHMCTLMRNAIDKHLGCIIDLARLDLHGWFPRLAWVSRRRKE